MSLEASLNTLGTNLKRLQEALKKINSFGVGSKCIKRQVALSQHQLQKGFARGSSLIQARSNLGSSSKKIKFEKNARALCQLLKYRILLIALLDENRILIRIPTSFRCEMEFVMERSSTILFLLSAPVPESNIRTGGKPL